METVELVIRISEKHYNMITNDINLSADEYPVLHQRIAEGVVLPKGHGRLIDEDALKKYIEDGAVCHKCAGNGWGCSVDCEFPDHVNYKVEKMLKEQETVVEADKEGA